MTVSSVHDLTHALSRGLSELTSGTLEAKEKVDQESAPIAAGETIQRIHLPVTGYAGRKLVWTDTFLSWPYPILNDMAAGQHESEQQTPHFATGVELWTDVQVLLNATIMDWGQDDNEFYVGAKLRISAWSPEAPKIVKYQGVIHVAFFGYSAAGDDDNDALPVAPSI